MNFEDFRAHRDELRRTRPELLDLSEMNVYRALASRFGPIAPSTHQEAPYRCHVAEQFLARLGFPAEWKARTFVSHGVRRSLSALFALFAELNLRVAIPEDVYPVYLELAASAGVKQLQTYEARVMLPWLAKTDVVLLCEPIKPWRLSLDSAQVDELLAWANASEKRLIVIDSAYSFPPTPAARRLLDGGKAMLLSSLSKGWLIPDHAGICVAPESWSARLKPVFAALPKDKTKLRVAYAALTEHSNRVTDVNEHLKTLAGQLDSLCVQRKELRARACVGYFAESPVPFEALLALGVLGIPASVFGSKTTLTLLSSLPPVRSG